MKQADRVAEQAAPANPVHGRAADARVGRPKEAAPASYQGKDLHIPNTTPAQFARVLMRCGVHPRPKVRKSATGE